MKPQEIIDKMKENHLHMVSHIIVKGKHEYYFTPAMLRDLNPDEDIKVLLWQKQDIIKRAKKGTGKKALYQVTGSPKD